MRALPALAALLAALALPACGGGGDSGGPPPRQVVDQGNAAAGREVFADNCAACHGGEGGGGTGPALAGRDELTDPGNVVDQIRDGGGGMPDFADRLSEQELADVSAFVVRELAEK